ncbi:MAG: VOC family protein [Gemmatimonadota bacterium]|nr:VOC family protein [Gemmatimonadota bacterium]
MSDHRGRFLWYELMTTDVEAAKSFYSAVTGWSTTPWETGDQPYTMWMTGEAPVGGLMELQAEAAEAGAPPHWLAYIGTHDLDATVERALELAAQILVPTMDVPEVGRMTILADPQGAGFAAFEPANEQPPEVPPENGNMSWHDLVTSDREAAWAFYSDLFGWETTEEMDMGEMGIYQMYSRPGGAPLGGIFNRPPEASASAWLLYAKVPDAAAAVEAVRAGGGQVLNGPREVPGGDQIATCVDPQGATFAVHAAAGD